MMILTNDEGAVGIHGGALMLQEGAGSVSAVEAAIRLVEADPAVRTVGRGGAPNLLGTVEYDAAIMEGSTRQAGAVGALRGYLHAITAARLVMERLPHVMLVGDGAARFAEEMGLERDDGLTDEARDAYAAWIRARIGDESDRLSRGPLAEFVRPRVSPHPNDTVICLARDGTGRISAGASTSGWPFKYPGRLGDTPIIGAGIYTDDRWGAAGCTYTGEMTIRCSTARSVVCAMRHGATAVEACGEAAQDLCDLHAGFIGPVVIHAVDRHGAFHALAIHAPGPIAFWVWTEGMTEPRRQTCAIHVG